jgi:hypothetical protein
MEQGPAPPKSGGVEMSTLTSEYELTDAVDEFCYDLAQAIRRILGLDIQDDEDDMEDEEDV